MWMPVSQIFVHYICKSHFEWICIWLPYRFELSGSIIRNLWVRPQPAAIRSIRELALIKNESSADILYKAHELFNFNDNVKLFFSVKGAGWVILRNDQD